MPKPREERTNFSENVCDKTFNGADWVENKEQCVQQILWALKI